MAIPSFFRSPQHNQFNFKNRYFDPEKEELKLRIEQAKRKLNKDSNHQFVPNIKGQMKRALTEEQKIMPNQRNSNIRLVLIILALTALAFYLFYSV